MSSTDIGGNNAVPMNDESRLEDQQQAGMPAEEDEEDLDAIELREALTALNAEGAGGEGEPEPEQHQQDQGTTQKQDAGNDGKGGQQEPPPVVPYPRFVEVNNRAAALTEENAFLKGQLSVRGTTGQEQQTQTGQEQQTAAEPSPAERAASINNELDELAGKFDDGELTARQWRQQERELSKQLEEVLAPEPAAAPEVEPEKDSAYLAAQTSDLYADYPRIEAMSEEHFDRLSVDVTRQLIDEGVDMRGEAATLILRTRMCQASEAMEQIYITRDNALAGKPTPSQAAPPNNGARASPEQHQLKRDMRDQMPPDIDQLPGSSSGGDESVTDAEIETMSEDEIMALPPAVRARRRGD